ncbi:unnamed protein product [Penicillium salamii]|uniref:SWR1-complex protein 3 domain-containing protein n=1 Tax=Penicillium salamii TaxID=1612424 RepID=A0A9W4JAD9_9EURO|nr:unnamed protein product [Penicillium salamii]CAG8191214.1 unnamed protein product [Penicillium salamii]CAG8285237.1 unnamed protein product [Penicillium salamii]CAG8297118.1 unnamed protein product [Penicillium salamii]CAG8374725.1 unnamed protein product [Penicillium salamii]
MAEKRKLPPRERREPAKRRVSEATPQSHRKKAPIPRAPSVDAPLPTQIKDADALPIVRTRQPATLSDKEYQSIAESAVLLASLERSKKKWLSDGILVRYYTKPKKTKREATEKKNPSKESMLKIGPCDVTIGPHLFDAMIYVVKDPNAPPSLQYTAPQRPTGVQWGVPHTPYRPYGSPSNAQRPAQYSPAPAGRPGYPGSQPSPHQCRPNQGSAPSPQGGQRPPQGQKGTNGQPAKPSPDPVIQMLATRAAADPDLKALMRVVASSQASQEQLRAFQAHIDELNAIIKSREQQEQRQQSSAGTPTPAPQTQSTPQPPQKPETTAKPTAEAQTPSSTPGPVKVKDEPTGTSATTSQPAPAPTPSDPAPSPAPTPAPAPAAAQPATPSAAIQPITSTPAPQNQSPAIQATPVATPQAGARPIPPSFQQPSYGTQPPLQSRPPVYGGPGAYRPPPMPIAPPRVNYKSVVFEFTSPLTPYGSSTSGHAGSGDRYLFPENTILEWLPAENTVIASFLIVRKVDPNTPFPLETATEAAAKNKAKGKGASKAKGDKKVKDEKGQPATPIPGQPAPTETPQKQEPTDPATPGMPTEANLKEYWQPVTFRIHAPNAKILEPLARVVRPAEEVRKYMNEIMDRAERSQDGYLAMRLPREEAEAFESEGTPASGAGTRSRLSRVQLADESEVESGFEEEDEEELKDFYDPPSGLAPMR